MISAVEDKIAEISDKNRESYTKIHDTIPKASLEHFACVLSC